MSAERFYKIVIVLLLLLNTGTLAFLWLGRPDTAPHPPRPEHDRIIVERLQLTADQQETFEALKHEHHTQILDIQRRSGMLHGELFRLLRSPEPDGPGKDSILALIQQTNLDKELVTYEHFKKLRQILNDSQKPAFDQLAADMSARIMAPHPPRR